MSKDFSGTGVYFYVGNTYIVNWGVVLEESDSFGEHAMTLCFDGVSNMCSSKT